MDIQNEFVNSIVLKGHKKEGLTIEVEVKKKITCFLLNLPLDDTHRSDQATKCIVGVPQSYCKADIIHQFEQVKYY